MAGLYIFYYNLVAPRVPAGRRYISQANTSLSEPGGCSWATVIASSLDSH